MLAYILQTSAQDLQQVLTAWLVGGQQIGQIQRQYQTVQRLPGAFLRQPVQHMGPQAAMQYIRILLLKEETVGVKNHRLFSHMRDNIPALLHAPQRLRGINDVGRIPFAQQRGFTASCRANDHIPR